MKLMAFSAPARAEVEAGVVAKADKYFDINKTLPAVIIRFCNLAETETVFWHHDSGHNKVSIHSFWIFKLYGN